MTKNSLVKIKRIISDAGFEKPSSGFIDMIRCERYYDVKKALDYLIENRENSQFRLSISWLAPDRHFLLVEGEDRMDATNCKIGK